MEALIGIELKVLGSDIVGIYEQTKEGYKILVAPSNPQSNEGITIDKLLEDINSLIGKTGEKEKVNGNELKEQLKAAVPSNIKLEEIVIKLKTAYLYVDSKKGADTKLEYAFSLDIVTEGVLPKGIELVDVKRLTVSVWNTDREKVLNYMSLQKIDTYLEG